jgi:predicted lipoprotein
VRNLLAPPQRKRTIIGVVWLALIIAMLLGTKFQSAAAVAKSQPAAFNAASFAKQKWPDLVQRINSKAADVTTLAVAVDADPAEAGKKYGQDLGAGSYAFAVKATGNVAAVDDNFMTLAVPGVPSNDVVRIPLGMALSGSPIRDATGTIHYGDFANQTDYQDVANALKTQIQQEVLAKITPASLKGKQLTVIGAFASGGPPNSYLINPVKIEVGP